MNNISIFCQNYVLCCCVCVYDCVMSIILVCVFISHMYIYQIRVCISAKPPSENEERKFKKEKYYKRVDYKILKF